MAMDIKTGGVIEKHSSGGGGVGDPAERDPQLVREDAATRNLRMK